MLGGRFITQVVKKPAVIDVIQLAFLLFEFEVAILQVIVDKPYSL